MDKWKKVDRKTKSKVVPYLLLILIATLFMGIGYSAINTTILNIEGQASAVLQQKVFITDVIFDESTEGLESSKINGFAQSMLNSEIVLARDNNASTTYTIQLHNNSKSAYIFDGVKYLEEFYDNKGIVFSLTGLEEGDVIEADGNLTFTITFSYKDNVIADNNVLKSHLNFQFIDISAENCNVEVAEDAIDVYNAETNKLSAKITNNNKYAISGNITFNGTVIDTFQIANKESATRSSLSLANKISGLAAKDGYDLSVNITSPCAKTINNIKVNIKGTFTNIEKYGVTVAGTNSDPYLVYAVEDLVRFAQKVNSGTKYSGKYIKQARALNFADTASYYKSTDTTVVTGSTEQIKTAMTSGTGFMGIGNSTSNSFNGTYLGNKLNELYINNSNAGERMGIFRYINGATIQNFGIESGSITCKGDAGAVVAYLEGTCTLTNCYNKANITNSETDYSMGGIIGIARKCTLTLRKCYNTGAITNGPATAGLIGFLWANTGETATAILEECYNTGTIKATTSGGCAAGLVRGESSNRCEISILRCYNSGNVQGGENVGGFVGHLRGTLNITDSYNIGNVTATNDGAGGLLGYKQYTSGKTVTVKNSYSAGTISAVSNKGGIIGKHGTTGMTGITCTNTYFWNTNSVTSTYGGTAKNATDMQAASFVTTLNNGGSNWIANSGGYPKLSWQ